MKTNPAKLLKVGYDWQQDQYVAQFEIIFSLVGVDTLSEFPGYDPLEESAGEEIRKTLESLAGRNLELELDDIDTSYKLGGPDGHRGSWGTIVWTETVNFEPGELEEHAPELLKVWERAIQHVELSRSQDHSRSDEERITWADETVLNLVR